MSTASKTISYRDFGAVCDGIHDDFAAIKASHDYANENGLDITASETDKFYIGNTHGEHISVKTNCNWHGATFIIDDKTIAPGDAGRHDHLFYVDSDYEPRKLDENSEAVKAVNASGGISADAVKVGYAPGYPALIIPYDETKKVYIRYGVHVGGGAQHELIIVDAEGNIDKDTPVLIPYDNVSYIIEYRIDDKPITLKGGKFITKANDAPCMYTYYGRGFRIGRSNVTISGFTHVIEDEGESGAPYVGFISCHSMNNLLVEDTILQGHKTYPDQDPNRRGDSMMGTYDIGGSNSNGLYFKNCVQSNFFDKDQSPRRNNDVWGIMGTNYCKNITYDGCTLSRLDAHSGVYNATVKDSNITYISLIGGGRALIENSTVYNSSFVILREDYGSTWKGDVIIRNSTLKSEFETATVIAGTWNNHYFGYKTYMPQNIDIDGLNLDGPRKLQLFSNFGRGKIRCGDFSCDEVVIDGEKVKNKNPMSITKSVKIKNTDCYDFIISPDVWLNQNVSIDEEE